MAVVKTVFNDDIRRLEMDEAMLSDVPAFVAKLAALYALPTRSVDTFFAERRLRLSLGQEMTVLASSAEQLKTMLAHMRMHANGQPIRVEVQAAPLRPSAPAAELDTDEDTNWVLVGDQGQTHDLESSPSDPSSEEEDVPAVPGSVAASAPSPASAPALAPVAAPFPTDENRPRCTAKEQRKAARQQLKAERAEAKVTRTSRCAKLPTTVEELEYRLARARLEGALEAAVDAQRAAKAHSELAAEQLRAARLNATHLRKELCELKRGRRKFDKHGETADTDAAPVQEGAVASPDDDVGAETAADTVPFAVSREAVETVLQPGNVVLLRSCVSGRLLRVMHDGGLCATGRRGRGFKSRWLITGRNGDAVQLLNLGPGAEPGRGYLRITHDGELDAYGQGFGLTWLTVAIADDGSISLSSDAYERRTGVARHVAVTEEGMPREPQEPTQAKVDRFTVACVAKTDDCKAHFEHRHAWRQRHCGWARRHCANGAEVHSDAGESTPHHHHRHHHGRHCGRRHQMHVSGGADISVPFADARHGPSSELTERPPPDASATGPASEPEPRVARFCPRGPHGHGVDRHSHGFNYNGHSHGFGHHRHGFDYGVDHHSHGFDHPDHGFDHPGHGFRRHGHRRSRWANASDDHLEHVSANARRECFQHCTSAANASPASEVAQQPASAVALAPAPTPTLAPTPVFPPMPVSPMAAAPSAVSTVTVSTAAAAASDAAGDPTTAPAVVTLARPAANLGLSPGTKVRLMSFLTSNWLTVDAQQGLTTGSDSVRNLHLDPSSALFEVLSVVTAPHLVRLRNVKTGKFLRIFVTGTDCAGDGGVWTQLQPVLVQEAQEDMPPIFCLRSVRFARPAYVAVNPSGALTDPHDFASDGEAQGNCGCYFVAEVVRDQ